jgi:hypothetical protein
MAVPKETSDACFSLITAAARAGARCPTNEQIGDEMRRAGLYQGDRALPCLARAGLIRIEVGPKNWRVAVILSGPAKGSHTLHPPHLPAPWNPYLIIGSQGRERSRLPTRA